MPPTETKERKIEFPSTLDRYYASAIYGLTQPTQFVQSHPAHRGLLTKSRISHSQISKEPKTSLLARSELVFTWLIRWWGGDSANAVPHEINFASEFPTFGEIAEVNSAWVQWPSLALGEPPSWSWLTPMPGKYALPDSLLETSQGAAVKQIEFHS